MVLLLNNDDAWKNVLLGRRMNQCCEGRRIALIVMTRYFLLRKMRPGVPNISIRLTPSSFLSQYTTIIYVSQFLGEFNCKKDFRAIIS
jgi:hypothetical protein